MYSRPNRLTMSVTHGCRNPGKTDSGWLTENANGTTMQEVEWQRSAPNEPVFGEGWFNGQNSW
jgi:hypothetical protein